MTSLLENIRQTFQSCKNLSSPQWSGILSKCSRKFSKSAIVYLLKICFSLPSKVPHAFQQQLSYEKTPTRCDAIPSFEAMSAKWEEYQYNNPTMMNIVQPGLDKLETYKEHANIVLVYVIAMSKWDLHSAIKNLQNTASYQPCNQTWLVCQEDAWSSGMGKRYFRGRSMYHTVFTHTLTYF